MKYALMVVVCSFLMAGSVSAQPQDLSDESTVAAKPEGKALSLQEILDADAQADTTNALGVWHCTAYAEGHGHSWGFDYYDVHYNHAYYGAMQTCEYNTHHHCHDVHCHYDY